MEKTRDISIEKLVEKAKEMRAYSLIAITAAGSGHTGGTLSIMDIAAVLYLKVIKHNPQDPEWDDRDRVIWSVGHKAPALYVALAMAGYYQLEDTVKLRQLWSGFEGHPNRFVLPGIEISAGSLGQGLGVAVGSALSAKLDGKDYRVYCIMGDGEQQEGSIWEAVMSAAHYHLDNLVGIIDLNGLQIDGTTDAVMKVAPLEEKYKAFGWEVIRTDGHDMEKLLEAFEKAEQIKGKPVVILAETVKGKGVSFAENVAGYHGIPPKDGRYGDESLDRALQDIFGTDDHPFTAEIVDGLFSKAKEYYEGVKNQLQESMPSFSKEYWWNQSANMKVDMDPTRMGFGRALAQLGGDGKTVAFGADITGSIKMDDFYKGHPERKRRFFSMGIAEQNMTTVAAGFAKEGRTAFIGSYGVFVSGRNWDQIRTTVCYNNLNVKIAGAHGGISVGPDGATHQALEEIPLMYYLPNMKLVAPCDAVETEKATRAITEVQGPGYIRFGREATPVVSKPGTPYVFGMANIVRFRQAGKNFIDAFDVYLSKDYKDENEDICIVSCGPMIAESMRAAWILKEEFNIETRIINMHTIKPLDKECLVRASEEIGRIITVEEQQTGGFGNIIAGAIATAKRSGNFAMEMMGINDSFGESGNPWDLIKAFGLTAEHIAQKCKNMIEKQ
ncbi:MAG: transketolase [Deltaproteobacteria bacterium]|nr:transketolase [Deltaproteobacteria bacterium]